MRRLSLCLLLLSACGPDSIRDPGGAGGPGDLGGDQDGDGVPDGPADDPSYQMPEGEDAVYAHSNTELYQVDPDTLEVSLVGAFVFDDPLEEMTDIAIDHSGQMIGISYTHVYRVDRETAVCEQLTALEQTFNALSFVKDGGGREQLLAAAGDGSVHRLDPQTGAFSRIGEYGGGLWSSGDLVSVDGLGTVATAGAYESFTDLLVRVDPDNGSATVIGETGVSGIWGLGFWAGKIYGFTSASEFVLIDPETGAATVQETSAVPWYGAGVTTIAPLLE